MKIKTFIITSALAILCIYWFTASKEFAFTSSEGTEARVEELLEKMTLEEKIGQMTQICFSTITLDGTKDLKLNKDHFREAILKYHVGSFLSGTGTAEKWAGFVSEMQDIAINESRLGIPLIIGIDHVHGANYVDEGTIFPHNLLMSCSFDEELVRLGAEITAKETLPLGLTWNFAPVADIGKNPSWPRLYETFGEDPWVCSVLSRAQMEGFQQTSLDSLPTLAACAKHFIGYSDPKSGWDRTPSEIPMQSLHEYFVPPFQALIDAGVKTVMVNSGELNGEAVHASKGLLKDLLREKMGFDGVIVTDIKDIDKIIELHNGAVDIKEATKMALDAGVDMSMACNSFEFCSIVKELVDEGKITKERIDQSVRRILKLKIETGLFEYPFPKPSLIPHIGSKEHKELAVEAAESSIVLLKNDGVLPFKENLKKILVAGDAAQSKYFLSGPWTMEWLGQPNEQMHPKDMLSIFGALQKELPNTEVKCISHKSEISKESETADAIVLTLGEKPYSEFKGNISDMRLEERQSDLLKAAIATGKPVIVILVQGRPRVIPELKNVEGVLFAGYPGSGGGKALASILSGKVNPSGKLSFCYPAAVGHHIPYYHKYSEKYFMEYTKKPMALYPFGHGLSYTQYEYSNFQLSDTVLNADGKLTASVDIKNIGNRDGEEVALWFISDKVGRYTRPVKMLKHFEKTQIEAGKSKTLTFEIEPKTHLSYPLPDGTRIIEPGEFVLKIGGKEKSFEFVKPF